MPEISSGIAAVRLGDLQLAVGEFSAALVPDLLLLVVGLLAGTAVVVVARTVGVWLGGWGLMAGIAAAAIVVGPARTYLWLGLDSVALVVVFALALFSRAA